MICFQGRDICAKHRVKNRLADAAKLKNESRRLVEARYWQATPEIWISGNASTEERRRGRSFEFEELEGFHITVSTVNL
jgi:hypothetical protein